jgi:quercetin dioxygenase-like cupin family protein
MTGFGTATLLQPGEGHAFTIAADRVTVKGSTPEGSDGFAVVEYAGASGQPGPPLHVHHTFEEAWYILEGEVDFTLEGRTVRGSAGTYVLIPRGVPHTFAVAGGRAARWVGIFSPARFVRMLEELGAVFPQDGPPDPQRVLDVFRAWDTEIVEAPGTGA